MRALVDEACHVLPSAVVAPSALSVQAVVVGASSSTRRRIGEAPSRRQPRSAALPRLCTADVTVLWRACRVPS